MISRDLMYQNNNRKFETSEMRSEPRLFPHWASARASSGLPKPAHLFLLLLRTFYQCCQKASCPVAHSTVHGENGQKRDIVRASRTGSLQGADRECAGTDARCRHWAGMSFSLPRKPFVHIEYLLTQYVCRMSSPTPVPSGTRPEPAASMAAPQ